MTSVSYISQRLINGHRSMSQQHQMHSPA